MANPPFAGGIKDKRLLAFFNEILTQESISLKSKKIDKKKFSDDELSEIEQVKKKIKEINKEQEFINQLAAEEYLKDYIATSDFKYTSDKILNCFSAETKIKTFEDYNKVSRDILFIERNLDFLKDGGRMAIVLPQGIFNNTTDSNVRKFIMERARILAVVGLNDNTFKPHTGTKTSVLFVQKWDENEQSETYNPKQDDYEIFMAVSQNSGKDNSGNEIWELDEKGEPNLGEYRHLIQKHDLKQIAEAFEQWAKKENLTFWRGKI